GCWFFEYPVEDVCLFGLVFLFSFGVFFFLFAKWPPAFLHFLFSQDDIAYRNTGSQVPPFFVVQVEGRFNVSRNQEREPVHLVLYTQYRIETSEGAVVFQVAHVPACPQVVVEALAQDGAVPLVEGGGAEFPSADGKNAFYCAAFK